MNKKIIADGDSPIMMNISTRTYVLILGTLAVLAGMAHGVFELLLGTAPTTDILTRIGAYSVLYNYKAAGIATLFIGLLLLFLTIVFIHKKYAPMLYFLLIALFFLVGGGIAPIFGLLIAWAVATQITRPLVWWDHLFSQQTKEWLANAWLAILITGFVLLLIGIGIWLFFTPPGETYQINWVDYLCWSFLGAGVVMQILTIIFGFARDIEKRSVLTNSLSQKDS
jgi:hypothetical protein